MQPQYIIQDWCSNTLQYNNNFNKGYYGQDLGTPKTFKTFEDAEEYLSIILGDSYESYREDYYIESYSL